MSYNYQQPAIAMEMLHDANSDERTSNESPSRKLDADRASIPHHRSEAEEHTGQWPVSGTSEDATAQTSDPSENLPPQLRTKSDTYQERLRETKPSHNNSGWRYLKDM